MAATVPPIVARFYRRLIAGMSALFGAGTLFFNTVALLAPPEVRHPGDPVALLAFDAAMGVLYLAIAWGVGWDRDWAVRWVWIVATLHAVSASAAAFGYVGEMGVSGIALTGALVREGFWVLIGLYLSRRASGTGKPSAMGGAG